jgi:hypothetical protein
MWTGRNPCPKCNGNHGDPNCSNDKDKMLRVIVAANKMVSWLLSCETENQDEWMDGMANLINNFAEVTQDQHRIEFNGKGFDIK